MPLPTVNNGESREDFIDRCMGDSKMNTEFPDQWQRFAVCRSIYEKMRTDQLSDDLDKILEE